MLAQEQKEDFHMKKIILILIFLFALPLIAQADDFIFDKGVEWGMSQKDVIKKTKGKGVKTLEKNADLLLLRIPFKEFKNADVAFSFTDKELTGVECIIKYINVVSNAEIYYQDYMALYNDYSALYGDPEGEDTRWQISQPAMVDEFKKKPGLAVSMGYLEMQAEWNDEDAGMHVELYLYSPANLKAEIKIVYAPL